MKKYNVKSIMSRAWAIYHETDKGDGLRPVFSICLAMAWEDAKNTPENILHQWAAMDTKAQINMLTANIKKAAKNEIGYSTEDHYAEFNETVAWFLNHHGIDGLVNEAWVKLAERLDADYLDKLNAKRAASGKVNISLVALVYRSAKDAIRAVRHASGFMIRPRFIFERSDHPLDRRLCKALHVSSSCYIYPPDFPLAYQ